MPHRDPRSGDPIHPGPSRWVLPVPTEEVGELVAIGGDLEPATLLAAYAGGLFPMPEEPDEIGWWSPVRRGVLPLDGLIVSRSLRRSLRRYELRIDTAFAEVVAGCADPARAGGWIDDEFASAYRRLHDLGWAHSVETWADGELVGGLYGVALGGLFAGESMFSRATDASKVALVGLVEALRDRYAERRLLDVQWSTPHLASLGVVEISRAAYADRLRTALEVPVPEAFRRPAGLPDR